MIEEYDDDGNLIVDYADDCYNDDEEESDDNDCTCDEIPCTDFCCPCKCHVFNQATGFTIKRIEE